MNIRADFSEVKQQLDRINIYAQQAYDYNITDWPHQKNQEDFKVIYRMDADRKKAYERLYCDGRDCAIWMSSGLLVYQQIGDDPTLKSYIESLEKSWVFHTEEMTGFLKSTSELEDECERPWAVGQMLKLYKKQIDMLHSIMTLVAEMKESDLYKKESGIKIESKEDNMSKPNININAPSNIQIGDHNKQEITQVLNSIIDKIEKSEGTPEAKQDAKSKLREFITHPLVTATLGGVVSGLTGIGIGV